MYVCISSVNMHMPYQGKEATFRRTIRRRLDDRKVEESVSNGCEKFTKTQVKFRQ